MRGMPARPPPLPGPLGRALATLYGAEIARRNRRFDARRGVVTLDRPVISVGNLSVGGTGKTPMVARLVRLLLGAGHRPCIAMRGYRARGGESDEASLYTREFPGLPIVAQPDRLHGLIRLFGTPEGEEIDCIVLDDGFQHRRLARQLDIVLIDASRDPFNDRLLPAGWLREPVASLHRAHAAVLTHAETAAPEEIRRLTRQTAAAGGPSLIAVARHAWAGFSVAAGGADEEHPLAWAAGRALVAACAIGHPEPFLAEAGRASGRDLAGRLILRDHDPYAPPTVRRLIRLAADARADAIIVTEKDWSKLRRVPPGDWPCPVVRPRLELRLDSGGDALDRAVLDAAAAGVPDDPLPADAPAPT